MTKTLLRKQYRDSRKHIAATARHDAAMQAAKNLLACPIFKSSTHISCYLPAPEEFETTPIIEAIWHANKHCYLPVLNDPTTYQTRLTGFEYLSGISHDNAFCMDFVRYQDGDPLHSNKYKILEPVNTQHKIAPNQLDLVIVPLLVFDLHGHRLGMGGGYYDRTFAFLHDVMVRKPFMLGLGFAIQQTEKIPSEEWDVKLDGVLTEKECIIF